jgi:hypothetical protein
MLALQGGYVFGDAHLPLAKYPPAAPPWAQVPGLLAAQQWASDAPDCTPPPT